MLTGERLLKYLIVSPDISNIQDQRYFSYNNFLRMTFIFSGIVVLARLFAIKFGLLPFSVNFLWPIGAYFILSLIFIVMMKYFRSQSFLNVSSLLLFLELFFAVYYHGGYSSLYVGIIPIIILIYSGFSSPTFLMSITVLSIGLYSVMGIGQNQGWFPAPFILPQNEIPFFFILFGNAMILAAGLTSTFILQLMIANRRELEINLTRYISLVENAPDPIMVYNPKNYFTLVNQAACDLLGFKDPGELIGKDASSIIPEDKREEAAREFGNALRTKVSKILNVELLRTDGKRLYLELHLTPIFDQDRIESFIGIFRDMTPRKQAEIENRAFQDKLAMQDKMASLGRLVLGISHEYNNILAGIRGYSQLAQIPGKENRLRELPQIAIELVDRAQQVTEGLLLFSEKFDPDTKIIHPEEMVNGIMRLMRKDFERNGIKFEVSIPRDIVIHTDIGKLQQVLLNLISNAQDAMKSGGTLKIDYYSENGKHVIQVSDQGVGIDKETLPHIFEPFFTTKGALASGDGQGIGLGLSVCYNIVRELGGDISVETTQRVGTKFKVILPIEEMSKM